MNINIRSLVFAAALAATASFTSCKKYLETENPSTTSVETTFNSISYTNAAVVGVYNKLIGDPGYGIRLSLYYPQSADDFKTSGAFSPNDRRGISVYGAAANNPELLGPFNQLYQGIERANICIKNIPNSNLYKNGSETDKATMRRLLGEVLTLRAQFYYELIRNWGDLPFHDQPSADLPDVFLPKTDRDVIYDHLIEDLKTASDLLPWRTEINSPSTRISKGVAKGLRARLSMARGGYSLRKESHQMERRSDFLKYYQIAYDECKDLISHREQHDLNPVYENIFKTLHTATRFDDKNELMFEVGAFGGNASTDSKIGSHNGLRINALSRFGGGGSGIVALPTYFYEFPQTGDVRRDITIGAFEIDKDSKKVMSAASDMTDAKFRRSWTSISGNAQNFGINWPILRFADILLLFAEADNEIKGAPSAGAMAALKEIRLRAYAGDASKIPAIPTTKTEFFNAIVKERLLEFGGEGIRKYDLIRWNLLSTKIEETKVKLRQFMNGEGQYASVPSSVYSLPSTFNNITTAEELKTLNLFGGSLSDVLYKTGTGETAPTGYTSSERKKWRTAVTEDYLTGPLNGYVIQFAPNRKELLPLPQQVINDNFKLQQDFGL